MTFTLEEPPSRCASAVFDLSFTASVWAALGDSVGRSAPCCFWPGSIEVEWAAVAGSLVEGRVLEVGSVLVDVMVEDGSFDVVPVVVVSEVMLAGGC